MQGHQADPARRPALSRDLLVFGEDWGSHPSSTQHLVSRLASDRRVVWANSIGLRKPKVGLADAARMGRKAAQAFGVGRAVKDGSQKGVLPPFPVVQPLIAPMATSRPLRALNRKLLAKSVGSAARAAGLERPVLWLSLPSAVDAVGAVGESAVVYYCGDDFGALSGVDHAAAMSMERELVGKADLILAASPALAARFPEEKTLLLPHGVDFDLFASPAARAPDMALGGPVAGFYGAVAPWIDLALVARAAEALPDWRFVFVGPVQTDISAVADCPNVEFLGPRPHGELPSYAQHWDAGLIPFLDTPQIRACNPLKLREYLASGRPVIATPFPAAEPYADHLRTVRTPDQLVGALRASLLDSPSLVSRQRQVVAAESWSARAAEAAAAIDSLRR